MLLTKFQNSLRSAVGGMQSYWKMPDGHTGFDPYEPIPLEREVVQRGFTRKFGKSSSDQLTTAQRGQLMEIDSFQDMSWRRRSS